MREVKGDARSTEQLLGGEKYAIDYYQREYKWGRKQVSELVDDLTNKFLENFAPEHERTDVVNYSHYFLGSIIISDKDPERFIIDGQQRLTTLTLLLIYLNHQLEDSEQKRQVANLIFSTKYGQRSFNLDIPERAGVMEALYAGAHFDENDLDESSGNILARYQDIEELFPDEVKDKALPYFVDWLMEKVHMVEITAYSDEDAYEIFETMNDRGLALTPTEMLKGYLLANITRTDDRNRASKVWNKHTTRLRDIGREEDADAIKSWLRSQYAKTIRERRRGAVPQDFDRLGTEFHRWVRENQSDLKLERSGDFAGFIEQDFAFYARWYHQLRRASRTLLPGLESVYYNARINFTLQYPVLLAPLSVGEDERESLRKLRITGSYLDILLARRIWNWRAISYNTMQYAMFLVMREIRGKPAEELAETLSKRLQGEKETFSTNDRFSLTGMNRPRVHYILARMTDYMETESGMPTRFVEYMAKRGKQRMEVEHIWANHPERHVGEFPYQGDFSSYRNRIGDLLLLPKRFNASYGDLPYGEKREHYLKQNLLAQSLHELAYERSPGFQHFLRQSGLPFQPHAEFKRADLDARQALYQQLADQVWNPARLQQELVT